MKPNRAETVPSEEQFKKNAYIFSIKQCTYYIVCYVLTVGGDTLVYVCLDTFCSHFLTIIAGVDLHFRHESELPVCWTRGLNLGIRHSGMVCLWPRDRVFKHGIAETHSV